MKKYLSAITISFLFFIVMILSFILGGNQRTEQSSQNFYLAAGKETLHPDHGPEQMDFHANPFVELADRLNPVVVNINTSKTVRRRSPFQGDPFFEDFFDRFFSPRDRFPRDREYQTQSLGSGFLISEDGYILTNNHVIKDADEIDVILYDGTKYSAEIIGRDPDTDVGLIKIDASGLPYSILGNSDQTRVGEWVVAIGNPFGLSNTVTKGIISAKERSLGNNLYDNYLQTDASINPGNSGGPLINLKGEVIGINSAIIAQAYGLGFAVPINTAKSLLPQLMEGDVKRGWLGISIQDLDDDLQSALNLPSKNGVLVSDVTPDSPAEKAGIKAADVIIEIDGEKMRNTTQLATKVALKGPDTEINIRLIREGRERNIKVKLGERDTALAAPSDPSRPAEEKELKELGLVLSPVTDQLKQRFQIPQQINNGLVILNIKPTDSYRLGRVLNVGDVIVEVNRRQVSSFNDLEREFNRIRKGEVMLLRIIRRNQSLFVTITK